jgi:hypothetical protein
MIVSKKKFTTMLFFTLFVSCLLLIEPCVAPVTVPANPRPAPDIVSVKNNDAPTWIPPTYYTHSYTGEVTQSTPGHYSYNGSIIITIKNRSIKPYTDKNGNTYNDGYYCIFVKIASNDVWLESPRFVVAQSDSVYTIITLSYNRYDSGGCAVYIAGENNGYDISAEQEKTIDFRIQSLTGSYWYGGTFYPSVYEGEGSKHAEFSITIPPINEAGTSKTPVQYPNGTSLISNYSLPFVNSALQISLQSDLIIILVTVCIIVIPIVLVTYISKQRKNKLPFPTSIS